jgi:hypothetical protein
MGSRPVVLGAIGGVIRRRTIAVRREKIGIDKFRTTLVGCGAGSCVRVFRRATYTFYDDRRECLKVVHLFGDDGTDNYKTEAGVFVHGHVAETNYPLQALCEVVSAVRDLRGVAEGLALRG